MFQAWPEFPSVKRVLYYADAADGYQIPVYAFEKKSRTSVASTPTSGVRHIYGGGMILGTVELFSKFIARQVEETSVPFFSVEYRRAPEVGGTTLVEDCYAGLVWLRGHAAQFNVDVARIAVVEESAGGGLAAGGGTQGARRRATASAGQTDPHLPDARRQEYGAESDDAAVGVLHVG